MTVVTTSYGNWTTHVGTLAEIMAVVNTDNSSPEKVTIFYNGTNMTAITFGG